jgi:nucleotide-binding universal stress UspA family protein
MCDDERDIGDNDGDDVDESAPPLPAADSVLSPDVDADRLQPGKRSAPPPSAELDDEPAIRTMLVVGIDGSDEADAALRWATHYGTRTRAVVHAYAVWRSPPVPGGDPRYASITVRSDLEAEAEARSWVHQALHSRGIEHGAEVHGHIVQGDPAEVLIELARTAELLVLGNHGRGASVDARPDSVTRQCARYADCPIVLVPDLRAARR